MCVIQLLMVIVLFKWCLKKMIAQTNMNPIDKVNIIKSFREKNMELILNFLSMHTCKK